jgi:hypothetical protein
MVCLLANGREVNGCEFVPAGKRAIILEPRPKAVTILGCTSRMPQPIEDQPGAEVKAR